MVTEFEPDGVFPLLMGTAPGNALEKLDFKQLQWPGHGGARCSLPVPGPRIHEGRGVRRVLFDPTGFYIHTYLPRVAGAEGLSKEIAKLPDFPGLHYSAWCTAYALCAARSAPEAVRQDRGRRRRVNVMFSHHLDWVQQINAAGYPRCSTGQLRSPYDFIADYFRGATGMMKDLYRHKDKLKRGAGQKRPSSWRA